MSVSEFILCLSICLVFLDDCCVLIFFFFQAEDGIRDRDVTGVQTCALPISGKSGSAKLPRKGVERTRERKPGISMKIRLPVLLGFLAFAATAPAADAAGNDFQIGRASCRERV